MTTEITLDWHGPFKPSDVGAEDQKKLEEKLRDIGQSVYASYYEISDNQFALYFGENLDKVNNPKELASDIERALILKYKEICNDRSECISNNTGLQGCKSAKNTDFKIKMSGADKIKNIFKDQTIYRCSRQRTKRRP